MRGAVRLAVLSGAMTLSTGCYTYAPMSTSAVQGSEVAVILTDRGRVALIDRVGPEMDELRGRLVSRTDSTVTLAMMESVSLRGVSANWTDEVITLRDDHYGSIRLKQFSRGRTTVLAGGFAAAMAVVVLTSSLVGGNSNTTPSTPPGGEPPSSRVTALTIPFRSNF
jgi:hypothetical protein